MIVTTSLTSSKLDGVGRVQLPALALTLAESVFNNHEQIQTISIQVIPFYEVEN